MTIKQWTDATMEVVAAEIFDNQKIVDNIRIARTNSLLRRLGMIRHPCPHIALCRIVYKSRGRLSSFTPLFVFSSSLQHGVAGERFGDEIEEALTHLTLGISPYSGSPCRFAHSERAIGVYLEENLKKIVGNSKDILIQIKTSLPPCKDCRSFWSGKVIVGRDYDMQFHDFSHTCKDSICVNCIKRDWLEYLKKLVKATNIAVSISCGVQIEGCPFISKEFLWRSI